MLILKIATYSQSKTNYPAKYCIFDVSTVYKSILNFKLKGQTKRGFDLLCFILNICKHGSQELCLSEGKLNFKKTVL